MAVGYLAEDWDATKVCTEDRGKRFIFAVHNFRRDDGIYMGIGFFDGEAFGLIDEEKDDYMSAPELWTFFKDEVVHGDISHFKDFEDDYVEMIDPAGEASPPLGKVGLSEETQAEVVKFFEDVANRYWD